MLKFSTKDLAIISSIVANHMLEKEKEKEMVAAAELLLKNGYVTGRIYGILKDTFTQLGLPAFEDDNIRFLQMGLLAREIQAKKLEGSVAELGVHRGNFSRYIRKAFPKRKYYLFDTFEGFDKEQARHDTEVYNSQCHDFSNTSVELVLQTIGDVEDCIVKKGFFPDTAADVDDRFVFVSVDVDLYQPTRDSLEFFYPRLVKGGALLVHDYGSRNYPGCGDAVREFCTKNDITFIPVPDAIVSALIVKQ